MNTPTIGCWVNALTCSDNSTCVFLISLGINRTECSYEYKASAIEKLSLPKVRPHWLKDKTNCIALMSQLQCVNTAKFN